MEMQETGNLDLIDLGHMAARLGKRAIAQKKLKAKISERSQGAAGKVEKVACKPGLTDEAVQTIKKEILGVASG